MRRLWEAFTPPFGEFPCYVNYIPLDQPKGQIRLLVIEPGLLDAELRCSLKHASLDDSLDYEALSYAWGKSRRVRRICLNSQNTGIANNLYGALKRLRRVNSERVVWIDALCINQADVEERNQQVSQMWSIYEKAKEVIVWLGEATLSSGLALNFLRKATRHTETDEEWMVDVVSNPENARHWEALKDLLSRDYWSRVWIIQEVVSASSLAVYCGNDIIPWDDFTHLMHMFVLHAPALAQQDSFWQLQLNHFVDKIVPAQLGHIRKVLKSKGNSSSSWDLYNLLMTHHERSATDPRDKVFALLGLVAALGDGEVPFKADYNLSKYQVYVKVVESCALNIGKPNGSGVANSPLNIICAAQPGPKRRECPSWAPEWDSKWRTPPLQFFAVYHGYYASGTGHQSVALDIKDRILHVTGFLVSAIEHRGEILKPIAEKAGKMGNFNFIDEMKAASRFDVLFSWWRLSLRNSKSDIDEKSTLEAFWRTVSCNRTAMFDLPTEELGATAERLMHHGSGRKLLSSITDNDPVAPLLRTMVTGAKQRRYCIARDGHSLMAPPFARVGDKVCVLVGCDFPVVLRKIKDHYVFIGECYVHGIMNGEAMEAVASGTYTLERFSIL